MGDAGVVAGYSGGEECGGLGVWWLWALPCHV